MKKKKKDKRGRGRKQKPSTYHSPDQPNDFEIIWIAN